MPPLRQYDDGSGIGHGEPSVVASSGAAVTGGRTLTLALAMAGGPTAPCALHSYDAESSLRACLITSTERLLKFCTRNLLSAISATGFPSLYHEMRGGGRALALHSSRTRLPRVVRTDCIGSTRAGLL